MASELWVSSGSELSVLETSDSVVDMGDLRMRKRMLMYMVYTALIIFGASIVNKELHAAPSDYTSEVAADAPYGWWRFEETTGDLAFDSSGNNLTAYHTGNYTLGIIGIPHCTPTSRCIRYDGVTGHTQCNGDFSPGVINPSCGWTVEAWVKPEIASGVRTIVGYYDTSRNGGFAVYNIQVSNGCASSQLRGNNGEERDLYGSTRIDDGFWHHIILVFGRDTEGKALHGLYIDGRLEDHDNWCPEVMISNGSIGVPLDIGCDLSMLGFYAWFYKGAIDEVAVYKKLLSPERIIRHAFAGHVVFGMNNRAVTDLVTASQKLGAWFQLWGKVTILSQDRIQLDDGSGHPVVVAISDHTNLYDGCFATVAGKYDTTSDPPTLISTSYSVHRLQ